MLSQNCDAGLKTLFEAAKGQTVNVRESSFFFLFF